MASYSGQRRSSKARRRPGNRWLAAIVGVGLVGVTAGAVIAKPDDDDGSGPAASSDLAESDQPAVCDQALQVGTPEAYLTVWRSVADAYRPDESCRPVSFVAAPSAAVATGKADGLDAWLPEDSSWVVRAGDALYGGQPPTPPVVARTPVMAVAAADAAPSGGVQPLLTPATLGPLVRAERPLGSAGELRIALPDVGSSATGALGFAALAQAASGRALTGPPSYVEPSSQDLTTIKVEHRVSTLVRGDAAGLDELGSSATSAANLAVSTEAVLLTAAAAEPDAFVAGYLGVDLSLPLVALPSGDNDAVEQFTSFLTSPAGSAALTASGLRPSRGQQAPPATGSLDPAAYQPSRPAPSAEQVTGLSLLFNGMHQRISSLVVLDASGSMLERLPGSQSSKIDLVRRAARDTLLVASPRARSGLVTFRSDANDRPVITTAVPLAPNGERTNGQLQSERLLTAVERLRVNGGTPLYNAVRDAYGDAVAAYDPAMINQVVLLSDGRNQDARGSISLRELLADLRAARVPETPVRIIAIGYGPDADMAALRRIVAVTEGRSSWMRDAADYADAVQTALFAV